MCLCLLTDGTKQNQTKKRQTEDREKEHRNQDRREVCDYRKLLGHLEAAHAIKRDVREYRRDENVRKVGGG